MTPIQPLIQTAFFDSQGLASVSPRSAPDRVNGHAFLADAGQAYAAKVEISTPSRLQSEREAAIELGSYARQLNEVLAKAAALTDDMKQKLLTITKQFPPFAADSDERHQYLQGFSGLRAQFEALDFPPEPEVTSTWGDLFSPRQEFGGNLPSLDPSTATDEQIRQAEVDLEKFGNEVAQQKTSLRSRVEAVSGGEASAQEARMLSQTIAKLMPG